MGKFEEIIDGWKHYFFKNEQVEEMAKNRIKICLSCSELKPSNRCTKCGCYMPAKVRSEKSKCPLKYW